MSGLIVTTVTALEWLGAIVLCAGALLGIGLVVAIARIRRFYREGQ